MFNMMKTYMESFLAPYVKNEEGQGMVEYALIIALVAVFLIAGLLLMRDQIAAVFTNITTGLRNQ